MKTGSINSGTGDRAEAGITTFQELASGLVIRHSLVKSVFANVGSYSPVSLSTSGSTHRCHCQRGLRLTGVIVNVGSDSTLSLSTCSHHLNVESHSKRKLENCDTI